MIVKGKQRNSGFFFWIAAIVVLLCTVLFLKFYKVDSIPTFDGESYNCDFETIKNECFADGDFLLSSSVGHAHCASVEAQRRK